MKRKPGFRVTAAIAGLIAAALAAGCGGKDDALMLAAKTEADRPSIAEAKAIAEEGFVFGLPIVMNYAAVHDLFLDPASGQYKAL